MSDLLITHLHALVSAVPQESIILRGGLGLMLKRRHLARHEEKTLARSAGYQHPEARTTTDIDLFLRIELFTHKEKGLRLRSVLDELEYVELTPKWQFKKPLGEAFPEQHVVVDLLSRRPVDDEGVRVKPPRVGTGSGTDLHGREHDNITYSLYYL